MKQRQVRVGGTDRRLLIGRSKRLHIFSQMCWKNVSRDPYIHIYMCSCVAQWLEHCVSSAKVVGSIPREHILTKKCITGMYCKSLWIKAYAKCINVNVNVKIYIYTLTQLGLKCGAYMPYKKPLPFTRLLIYSK